MIEMTKRSNKEGHLTILWRLRNLFLLVPSLLVADGYAMKLLHWLVLVASQTSTRS